jgi:hypothetical protein
MPAEAVHVLSAFVHEAAVAKQGDDERLRNCEESCKC